MSKVIIIGGGAAGMMAAAACDGSAEIIVLEQNEKLGKKLFITGKGRCNLTNACETEELFEAIVQNPRFLYSSIYQFDNRQVMEFFKKMGLTLKVERGNRVFPSSDHSSDVIKTLEKALAAGNVTVRLNTKVTGIITEENEISKTGTEEVCTEENRLSPTDTAEQENRGGKKKKTTQTKKVTGVMLKDGSRIKADCVVIATGGLSYPTTGATGDGYKFAEQTGHKVTECSPSLVPMNTKESYVKELMGLSLKNVYVSFYQGAKCLYSEMGEMMFTHFGVTGPIVLSASALINTPIKKGNCRMEIDLKPALEEKQLDRRILRDWEEVPNRQYKNSLQKLLPAKLIPVVIRLSGISENKKINEITKEERKQLVNILKHFPVTITGLRGYEEAVITRGGVSVRDVDPASMESKKVKGLYFAGEILDTDALTGGYNLQIAWSTGYLAGVNIYNRYREYESKESE